MNKKMHLCLVVGMTVLLSGCSLGSSKDTATPAQIVEEEQAQEKVQEQTGPSAWIAGLGEGKKMQCTYTIQGEGNKIVAMKMYAEKDRYKTEMETPTGMTISLFDGKTLYSWTKGMKQGTKMEKACLKELEKQTKNGEVPATDAYDSPEQAIETIPNISCSVMEEEIDFFSVPSDIVFADQCELMKNALKQMRGLQNVPSNIPAMPDISGDLKNTMGSQ